MGIPRFLGWFGRILKGLFLRWFISLVLGLNAFCDMSASEFLLVPRLTFWRESLEVFVSKDVYLKGCWEQSAQNMSSIFKNKRTWTEHAWAPPNDWPMSNYRIHWVVPCCTYAKSGRPTTFTGVVLMSRFGKMTYQLIVSLILAHDLGKWSYLVCVGVALRPTPAITANHCNTGDWQWTFNQSRAPIPIQTKNNNILPSISRTLVHCECTMRLRSHAPCWTESRPSRGFQALRAQNSCPWFFATFRAFQTMNSMNFHGCQGQM